jgi:SOS-response transcriptional repressor LexA
MNQAEINGEKLVDGKLAIVDRDAGVSDEDIVLAIIDNAATIKLLKKSTAGDEQIAILKPRSTNSKHQPIYVKDDDLFLNGKVILVLDR